jgi:hypothetical protein
LPATLVMGVLFGAPALASATIRFAAPGGSATAAQCVTDANPCTIFEAAQGTGVTGADEVVVAPGNYSDSGGDLGPSGLVQPIAGNIHGEVGRARPVITLDIPDDVNGAFFISGTTVSDLEIDTAVNRANYVVFSGGLVQNVIARSSSTASQTIACTQDGGTIRNSVCLTSGVGAAAIGASLGGGVGTMNVTVRNVTAVSTGAGSFGASYRFFGGSAANWIVNARSVIAQGTSKDVVAGALLFSGSCPNTTVSLDFSDYLTTQTQSDACGGIAAVSPAGSGNNQTAAPTLASDGFHQVAGSITIDHGFADGSSTTTDIDGQARMIGSAPDIGADELAFPTSTAISCTPDPLVIGTGRAQCAVTVTDTTSPPPVTFLSGVRLTSDMPGSFAADCETLFMATPTQGTCTAPYTPTATGLHTVTAVYPGDATHDSSQATDAVSVTRPGSPPGGTSTPPTAPKKKCKKKKKKHHAAAAKKKCKKKKRR